MSLQLSMLFWFYFAIGFGFFLGGICTAPPVKKDTRSDIAGAFFVCVVFWPCLIIILLWE